MSLHMTQFYQAFPRVSNTNDKHWSEKAWVDNEASFLAVQHLYQKTLNSLITEQRIIMNPPRQPVSMYAYLNYYCFPN